MRSRQTRPVVYSGKVGAKMKPLAMRKGSAQKVKFYCQDGPMKGYALFLTADGTTAQMNVAGQIGRYNQGKWEASCT